LEKRDFWYRFKRLNKHTGKPQWGLAVRAIILMAIAGLIGKFLGFNNGINAIIVVTLLASIIIDISLPIKKVATLTVLGFLMTILAFISASLGLSNIGLFVFFTVIWSFFSISMYIFGSMEGSLGFTFFLTYFIAVLLVNNQSSTLDWASYSIIAYLVASILFIPKIWLEKKKIKEMVSVGFNPASSLHKVLYTRNILGGIPINSNYYDIFKLGSYFKIFRSYSNLINSRLNSKSRLYFKNFLDRSDDFSSKIAYNFNMNEGPVDLTGMDKQLSSIESNFLVNKNYSEIVIEISHSIMEILNKSNKILSKDNGNGIRRIKGTDKPLKEVLKANFNINNLYIRHALRFTLAMTISLIFVYLTRERSAIWITMGVLIILKPDITSTIDNLISRVGYNFLAIILAIILSLIFPHDLLIWLALIMLFLFRAFYPNYMGFSVMAMTVFIVLIWPTGTVYDNAIDRLVDIALGGVIAFICAYLILPSRVTVNLPDQLIRTIKANIKYAKHVLIISSNKLNTKDVSKSFKNYVMEENNLEAGLKKLEDTFKDIDDDLELYHGLIASNNKLTADLSGIAAILNTNKKSKEYLNINVQKILTTLNYLENSLTEDIKPLKLYGDHNLLAHDYNHKTDELEQLIGWITSDLQLIQKGIDIANETGLLQRYTKLN